MSKRKAIKEMLDAVEKGQAFTVYGKNGEPLAMVLPWSHWQALNKALIEAEERLVPAAQSLRTGTWPVSATESVGGTVALGEPICQGCGVVGGGHTRDCIHN